MDEPALVLNDVGFRYRIRSPTMLKPWRTRQGPGVHNVSFSLPKGCIVGLVGPNGAGKTTLMRLLCGLSSPHEGEVRLSGEVIAKAGINPQGHLKVGFMPEQVRWSNPGTPRSTLEWISALQGGEDGIEKILSLVGLESRADDPLDAMSQGMRQRLTLATALLGDPQVLILDEPLNGLDPVAQAALRGLLSQLADDGRTILVSSHMLAELDQLVERIVLMHRGQVVAEGSIAEVESDLGLHGSLLLSGIGKSPLDFLQAKGLNLGVEESAEGEWAFQVSSEQGIGPQQRAGLVESLSAAGYTPHTVAPSRPDLAAVLSAATGMSSELVGLDVDEHLMVPLAKPAKEPVELGEPGDSEEPSQVGEDKDGKDGKGGEEE